MQDIIPPKKRKSIRDIPLPDGKVRITHRENDVRQPEFSERKPIDEVIEARTFEHTSSDVEDYEDVQINRNRENTKTSRRSRIDGDAPRSKKKFILIATLAFALIFTIFLVSRESAKVYVFAKELTQSTNTSIEMGYEPVKISLEKTVSVKATGEEQVTEKSKGRITIYNEYEETEQRLLKETRFESPQGLIFRIPSSVVVPGLTRDDKGNVIPGKLEVEVVADKAGEEYNIAPTRFTIPGFKDLPQYDSFYAISENPTDGGFDGVRKVVSETDREEAERGLKAQLKEELVSQAVSKTTDQNLVLATDSMITYEILGDKVNGNNVTISARGTIDATSFNAQEFSNLVAKSVIPNFSDVENVEIKNIKDLSIGVSKKENSTASLDISGNISFLWKNDQESLKKVLAGTDKNSIKETVEMFPGITKISTEISPFWSSKIPENIEKIKIIDSKN